MSHPLPVSYLWAGTGDRLVAAGGATRSDKDAAPIWSSRCRLEEDEKSQGFSVVTREHVPSIVSPARAEAEVEAWTATCNVAVIVMIVIVVVVVVIVIIIIIIIIIIHHQHQ
jgi:hypothetical protein